MTPDPRSEVERAARALLSRADAKATCEIFDWPEYVTLRAAIARPAPTAVARAPSVEEVADAMPLREAYLAGGGAAWNIARVDDPNHLRGHLESEADIYVKRVCHAPTEVARAPSVEEVARAIHNAVAGDHIFEWTRAARAVLALFPAHAPLVDGNTKEEA